MMFKKIYLIAAFCMTWALSAYGGSSVITDNTTVDIRPSVNFKAAKNRFQRCEKSKQEIIEGINDRIRSVPSDFGFTGSAFNICNSTHVKSVYTVPEDYESLDANFLFSVKNRDSKAFWIFVFRNDEDITKDIFEDTNLVQVEDGEIEELPIIIDRLGEEISSISVLGVDAGMRVSDFYRHNNFFVSVEINTDKEIEKCYSPKHAIGGASLVDPSPEYISFSLDSPTSGELVFSVDQKYSEINVVAINFESGKRVPILCNAPDRGILTIKHKESNGPVSVSCLFPSGLNPEKTVVGVTSDYFMSSGENKGAFNTIFTRMLATH